MINSTNKKRIELWIQRNRKHGQAGTPTYVIWKSMIGRCERSTDSSYKWYGAKGITVCERWHDFQNFFQDMGEAPNGSHLHRLNGSKIYSKETCQWINESDHIGLHNSERGWGARLTRSQLIDRVAALNQELTAERENLATVRELRELDQKALAAVKLNTIAEDRALTHDTICDLQDQLAAERERREQANKIRRETQIQLARGIAREIVTTFTSDRLGSPNLLHQHDAEVRKPLVDALEYVREQVRLLLHGTVGVTDIIHYCDDALAKEGNEKKS